MSEAVRVLRDPATIRERCAHITAAVERGESCWFSLHPERLAEATDRVIGVIRKRYPNLRIPYHSRWRHFEAGGIDRAAQLAQPLSGDAAEQARSRIDLAIVSVLLDAGAGPSWRYVEPGGSERSYTRSEGLGVASFHAFMQGRFSSDAAQPLRVDGAALATIDAAALASIFQVRDDNPLVGLEGRAELLRRLGRALLGQPDCFGTAARPGALFDMLTRDGHRLELSAMDLLSAVLQRLSSIWLTESRIDGEPLGDVWRHPHAGGTGASAGWVPFHKLSQWLAYSLFEPFEWAGVTITSRDTLTALPEYRNGGLLIDAGVLQASGALLAAESWTPGSEPIVEWRAMTITLIDRLAVQLRETLGMDKTELPLACVLEGGTWAAGRELAVELRAGLPPLNVVSDGTVF